MLLCVRSYCVEQEALAQGFAVGLYYTIFSVITATTLSHPLYFMACLIFLNAVFVTAFTVFQPLQTALITMVRLTMFQRNQKIIPV
jgi:predicted membrane protein